MEISKSVKNVRGKNHDWLILKITQHLIKNYSEHNYKNNTDIAASLNNKPWTPKSDFQFKQVLKPSELIVTVNLSFHLGHEATVTEN